MKQYVLTANLEVIGTFHTLEEALKERNEQIRKEVYERYDNDEIDKYAVEDWLWQLDENTDLHFVLDTGQEICFDIEEKILEEERLEEREK